MSLILAAVMLLPDSVLYKYKCTREEWAQVHTEYELCKTTSFENKECLKAAMVRNCKVIK